jgi:AcrR family transcriptional regulator
MPAADGRRAAGESLNRRTATKERANSRGDATRLLLLMTAEQLFAERGIEAVPLRDIGAAAGQKNNGVVQYYFGNRDSLVSDIIAYRAAVSEKLRVEMLADILAQGLPKVSDLVKVFVLPMAVYMEDGNYYIPLLSRYIIEHGGYAGLDRTMIPSATVYTLRGLLGRLLPGTPEGVLDERWLVMMTSTIHTLARYQTVMTSGAKLSAPIDALLDDLVRFLTAGIEAPHLS